MPMCGIAGFYNADADYTKERGRWEERLAKMRSVQRHRGPDDAGEWLCAQCGMAHARLSIIDLQTGHQPMHRCREGRTWTMVFNGEIYNMQELKRELQAEGEVFETASDTEVVLCGLMRHGFCYLERLNGIFAMAVWDGACLHLVRDRLGVKPLFYTWAGKTLVFSSEIKGLFVWPKVEPVLDREGLCEVFALGPARTYGKGVFKGILEVLPGSCLSVGREGVTKEQYWRLKAREHTDTMEETVEKTAWLLRDAVKKQMLSDVPICTFLSGGVDSSLVTAICAGELKKQGRVLDTFSFDFTGNDLYFQSNDFQPSRDLPFVERMAAFCGTNHRYLECSNQQQLDYLYEAVDARDLPGMADVESSMVYFCECVAEHNKVALTGECADEIFGGYPWFHKAEAFENAAFPWSPSMEPRQTLLSDEWIRKLPMAEYAHAAYARTVGETPGLEGECREEARRREISYLNLRWFMATLLDRMDRASMHAGLEARVPFADHRIVEYLYNVPWNMKCPGGIVKGLLRRAGEGLLPKEVLWRRKSPYPKTYHPAYERMLSERLKEVMESPSAPIRDFLDRQKVELFVKSPKDYGRPWYGQLMAGPQMMAYMLQVNYWLEKYRIRIEE